MKQRKFKIGELSQLCNVTTRALYHYEKMGLLVPDTIDPYTGYRYYNSEQLLKLAYIVWIKEQGFTLSEIKNMFDTGDYTASVDQLNFLLKKCEKELTLLNKRHACLKSLIADQRKKEVSEEIYFDKLPSMTIASHMTMISCYEELKELVMNVIGPEMLRLGCRALHPIYCFSRKMGKVSADGRFEVEFCEEVQTMGENSDIIRFKQLPEVPLCICMKIHGRHDNLETCQERLIAETAERGYRAVDIPRINYVNGFWNQKNPDKWFTIIQIPVKKMNVE